MQSKAERAAVSYRNGCSFYAPAGRKVTIHYGVVILFTGLCKVQWTIDALRLKIGRWFLPAVSAVVSIICGFVVLSDPFAATLVLWMFTGISLIVEAALDVVVLFFGRGGISGKHEVK